MIDIAFNNMQTQDGAISPVISPWPGVTHEVAARQEDLPKS